jgi:hypothetical protein
MGVLTGITKSLKNIPSFLLLQDGGFLLFQDTAQNIIQQWAQAIINVFTKD